MSSSGQYESESMDFDQNKNWTTAYRKYSRITPEMKDKLIFLIVRNNMSIKQAAQYLKINYSSAKFIFSQYRDKTFNFQQHGEQQTSICGIRKLQDDEDDGILLKSTIGGKYEGETDTYKNICDIYKGS